MINQLVIKKNIGGSTILPTAKMPPRDYWNLLIAIHIFPVFKMDKFLFKQSSKKQKVDQREQSGLVETDESAHKEIEEPDDIPDYILDPVQKIVSPCTSSQPCQPESQPENDDTSQNPKPGCSDHGTVAQGPSGTVNCFSMYVMHCI